MTTNFKPNWREIIYWSLVVSGVYVFIIIGLGPLRRNLKPIIPDIFEYKVNVNAVCDGPNKVYIFTGDNGSIAVQVVVGGCPIPQSR